MANAEKVKTLETNKTARLFSFFGRTEKKEEAEDALIGQLR